MAFSLKTPPAAFGFDLSDTSAKLVQLRKRGRGYTVDVSAALSLTGDLIADGEIQDLNRLSAALESALAPYRKKLVEAVIVSLPESKTFIQTITLSKEGGAAIEPQLTRSLPEYLPLPVDEMYHDHAVVEETDQERRVVVGAAPKPLVDRYLKLLEQLGLIPLALEIQALAIARTLIPASEATPRTRAIIDLGRHRANLIVHDHGTVQFTVSLPIAGDELTQSIASALDLSTEQAEKAKVTCGLDPQRCQGVLRTVLEEMVQNLVKRIGGARDFYQDRFSAAHDFEEILLCGGGAHLLALDQVLSQVLKVPVRVANPWESIRSATPPELSVPLQYTTAVGLALRGVEGEPGI